jgi:glycosyltransferase involved in cell wall biosynthesis
MGEAVERITPMKVAFFGFDEHDEGGRAWSVRTGLFENGIDVKLCRTDVNGFFAKYRDLYQKWKGVGDVDALYVIFMGYYLMPLAWYLANRRCIPVILDALVSQYDTEVNDRKRLSRFNPRAWFLWLVDFVSCHMADAIVVDTDEHKKFFAGTYFVDAKKIIVVPVGCRSDLFTPEKKEKTCGETFVVEFHGGFVPLHGIEHILGAAKILQDKKENVRFLLTGGGQLFDDMFNLSEKFMLANVEFQPRKRLDELPECVRRGDVCLGIFGATAKALRVIPHKVYECLSCGKPVITERSPAVCELLRDREDILMVNPGDGADLAEKILELKSDAELRARLGERALGLSLSRFSPREITRPLVNWLERI